ncbi:MULTISPECIES: EAL domain-containing protein [unclassified Geobacillus]|uniref:EAL domain-containing protein n=1 Tax=unclassified Geobacillus TaxID=2642459 RepID=UPI000D3B379B|nr:MULTISPECIES: EAL domain-containing protein [unclassified Geobacillus]PUF88379.1 GGDEF domain-containing protein [Geobacillus sp. LYN3]TXK88115.1 EAL domain-containing protein [Geobacillus sp. AYS3]
MSKEIEYTLFVLIAIFIVLVIHLWLYRVVKKKLSLSLFQIAPRLTVSFYMIAAALLFSGIIYINYLEKEEHKEYEEDARNLARLLADGLSNMHHEQLNEQTDENDETYVHILQMMEQWQNDHSEILSMYTLKKNERGNYYFVVASEVDYKRKGKINDKREQHLPIGTVYRTYIPELEQAFQGKFAMEKYPTKDEWGESIGVFMPVFKQDGTVDAVLGIGYDAKIYKERLEKERQKGMWICSLVLLVWKAFYLLGIYMQVERKLFEKHKQALEVSENRFKRLAESIMEGIIVHVHGKVIEANKAACRLFGYVESELIHMPVQDLMILESLKKIEHNDQEELYEIQLRRKDGTIFPAEMVQREYDYDGRKVNVTAIRDITERKNNEEKMHYIATHDDLTGLPNKEALHRAITEKIQEAFDRQEEVAIMFLEISGMKTINDFYGYSVGDQVLLQIVEEWKKRSCKDVLLGRWSGNEFIAILSGSTKEKATVAANQFSEIADEPVIVEGRELYVTIKIGISLYPQDGMDPKTLIRKADIARYKLRQKPASQFLFFEEPMARVIQEKIGMERELRRALEKGEFELYYQPQIQLDTGMVTGMEALIRWNHPEKGLISPYAFIPVAEQTGMIIPINEWVIRMACQQTKQLLNDFPNLSVSVNLSPYEFENRRFVHKLMKLLEETGLPPHHLDLEITERMTIDTERAITILKRLKSIGVTISMDDFGTGYSSLSYLTDLPIDRLKIDRSFVRNIQGKKEAILPSIIRLGHNIGVKVLAEGVETETEVAYLKDKHCDEAQGYYFAQPLSYKELKAFLYEHRCKVLQA